MTDMNNRPLIGRLYQDAVPVEVELKEQGVGPGHPVITTDIQEETAPLAG